MLTRTGFSSLGALALLASMVCASSPVQAQDAGSWQAERARHVQTINERVKKMADQKISLQKTAAALRIPWPVKPPTQRKDQIVAKIEEQVDKEAKAKFPDAKRKEFLKEAQELYRVYKPGDLVPEFKLKREYGTNTIVREGYLHQVTEQRIRLGRRWLIPADLTDEMKARFYDEYSEKMIKSHVRKLEMEYDREIDEFKKGLMEKRLPLSFLNAGYCPKQPDFARSTDARNWWSQEEAVKTTYELFRAKIEADLRGKIETEVFQANGYVRVPEKKNEWMPRAEAEAYRQQLREEAERKRGMDVFGGGGGAPDGMMMEPGMGTSGDSNKQNNAEPIEFD